MKYRQIISDAWGLTQNNKRLIWWFAFLPALVATLSGIVYVAYQTFAFYTSSLVQGETGVSRRYYEQAWEQTKTFYSNFPTLSLVILVVLGLTVLAYFFLPVFSTGALIQLLAKARKGEKMSMSEGVSFGFSRFLPLLEYHLAIRVFSVVSVFSLSFSVLRNLGPDAFYLFMWIFIFVLVVGVILTLLFTYSEYYIVLENRGVFESMIASGGMVIRHWHHTLFMLLLLAIITVRIGFNLLAASLLPIIVIAPIFLFTSLTLQTIGIIVGSIVGAIGLYFTAYFLGVFHVFVVGVWTFTFLELTNPSKAVQDKENQETHAEGQEPA